MSRSRKPVVPKVATGIYLPDYGWQARAASMFPPNYFANLTIANYRYMYLYPSYIRTDAGYMCKYCGRITRFNRYSDLDVPECPGCRQIIAEGIVGKNDGEYTVIDEEVPTSQSISSNSIYTKKQLGFTIQRTLVIRCLSCGNVMRVSIPQFMKRSFRLCKCYR